MDLKHLHTFKVVADTRGFTKAAEQLSYAQSSVTTQIQALEEELHTRLFDRLGKQTVLTEAGQKLLPYAIKLLELHDTAVTDLTSSLTIPSGTLTIGAPESLAAFRLPAIIHAFTQRYPQVKLILRPGACRMFRNLISMGDLDLAFVLEPELDETQLHCETLALEQMALIAPPSHPLAALERVDTLDLKDVSLLHTEPGCSYRALLEHHLASQRIYKSSDLEFWSIETIKNCVIAGLGISLLPLVSVRSEIESGKLIRLPWDDSPCRVATQMVYHPDKWMSPALQAFINLTRSEAASWR
ncbi:LysR family transcriptional regulator [Paenibacillus pini]|uniref:HTH lysR-type domain-containing protein n=1 Tax=Paenibacillus pini JCM 16418 TaxID=1236976 RepID=W7YP36_9BACL|nr:LysR family transcriptional regulator [Paenibacillus pini]GAF10182.1 hypothetical protein JCM16418_4359 [Paenibacillus pini JCM 16418]